MHTRYLLLAAAALATLLPLHAQDSKEGPLYKVEINFRDGNDAGSMTDRRYTLVVMEARKASFKAGNKSPVASGTVQPQPTGALVSTEFTYLDIGVSIDCSVQAVGARAALHGSLDLSNIGPSDPPAVAGVRNPTIRQTKLNLDTILELGKPTVLAAIDDPLTARKLQVEATVTKL